MTVFEKIQGILADILDVDPEDIKSETYVIRDLDVESIDLLELAVSLSADFHIDVADDEAFLKDLRLHLGGSGNDAKGTLLEKYPYLTPERVAEILLDEAKGPVLKVKDLVDYVIWRAETA